MHFSEPPFPVWDFIFKNDMSLIIWMAPKVPPSCIDNICIKIY